MEMESLPILTDGNGIHSPNKKKVTPSSHEREPASRFMSLLLGNRAQKKSKQKQKLKIGLAHNI